MFGVTAAYQAGSTKGGVQGAQNAKANIAGILTPQVNAMRSSLQPILNTLEQEGATNQGTSTLTFAPVNPVDLDQADIAAIRQNLAGIDGAVQALR